MTVPSAWVFVLLGLAAFRTWKLLAEDSILDRPRAWFERSEAVAQFLPCPWCFGAWCVLGWWAAWQASPHWALVVAVPFALSALVAAVAITLNALAGES